MPNGELVTLVGQTGQFEVFHKDKKSEMILVAKAFSEFKRNAF